MGLACRVVLLDQHDALYRLPNTKFEQMLRDPTRHRLSCFAGMRVRMAEVIVELLERQPLRVVRTVFDMVAFDDQGCMDTSAFDRHQRARAELAMAPLKVESEGATDVVEAAARFIAQGGRWRPSRALSRLIDDAALGRVRCRRL